MTLATEIFMVHTDLGKLSSAFCGGCLDLDTVSCAE